MTYGRKPQGTRSKPKPDQIEKVKARLLGVKPYCINCLHNGATASGLGCNFWSFCGPKSEFFALKYPRGKEV
mgnify:CR=1 FL=1